MSFEYVGYETLPVDAIKSAMVPVGFAASDAVVLAGPGAEGYYAYPAETEFLRGALVEWPAVQQVRTFYFARWRLCNDPKVREKIEKADQEVHRRNLDRLRITEALRAKRSEKASILSQVKRLEDEVVQLAKIIEKKVPISARESGLCSSEEELNDLLSSIHYRISNCSISEQRRLSREIKRLENTREKVRSTAAIRAWVLELSPECATQGQFSLPEEVLEEVKKKQEEMRENIKLLNGQVEIVNGEIKAVEEDLADVTFKRDRAYTRIQELRKQRDDSNGYYYRNRAVLKDAMELAATNDVATLEEVAKFEVESFFSLWNSDRSFRENYMRRIRPSLDLRQLDRDGRRKGLEAMPSAAEEVRANSRSGKGKEVRDEAVFVIKEVAASSKVILGNGGDLASGKNSSSGIVPSSVPVNGDDLASGKKSRSGIVPSSVSENGDDLASGKNSSSGIVPSSVPVNGDDLASGKKSISGIVPSSVSENGDDLASGKNSSSGIVPSSVSENDDDLAGEKNSSFGTEMNSVSENGDGLAGGKDIISVVASSVPENGDDLESGKNSSFEIVPSSAAENGDDSGKNSSFGIVPGILSENADDFAGKDSSFMVAPIILSENADDLAIEKKRSLEIVPDILSENADDLAIEKKRSLEIVPDILSANADDLAIEKKRSLEIVPDILSENADDSAGKNSSFGIVPSILPENGDDLASEKNTSLGIVLDAVSENGDDSASEKNSSCVTVVNGLSGESDEAEDVKLKLKELRREEEIAKAKKAMERKKKLAEKNAAKAAIKAQKEAEKKLKEQEKKARKKVTVLTASSEQAEDEKAEDEKADENSGTLTRVKQGIYYRRDKFWRRHKAKGSDAVLKAILKRRRSANYWFWAVTIALFLAVFTVLGYCFFLQKL